MRQSQAVLLSCKLMNVKFDKIEFLFITLHIHIARCQNNIISFPMHIRDLVQRNLHLSPT